jgi:DNA-binding Lrp family transcriptional regulator
MSDQGLPHNKKKISRKELLKMINDLESQICIEGFSTVLNWKESLGFGRNDEYNDKKYSK